MAGSRRSAEKEAFWRGIVEQQKVSGLSARAFCTQESVSEGSFYAWRKELERRDQERSDQERSDQERSDQERSDQERSDQEQRDQSRAKSRAGRRLCEDRTDSRNAHLISVNVVDRKALAGERRSSLGASDQSSGSTELPTSHRSIGSREPNDSPNSTGTLELETPSGFKLRFDRHLEAAKLHELLHVVASCCPHSDQDVYEDVHEDVYEDSSRIRGGALC